MWRSFVILTLFVAAGCASRQKTISVDDIWRQGLSDCGLPTTSHYLQAAAEESGVLICTAANHDWLAVTFDVRSNIGIRGQNGPLYVYEISQTGIRYVGAFFGQSLMIVEKQGKPVVMLHYHAGVDTGPDQEYPYNGKDFGSFNPTGM